MAPLQLVTFGEIPRLYRDPVGEAMNHLEEVLPRRAEAHVLMDFLDDELRESRAALDGVEAHFTDVLDALRAERPSPAALVELAEDPVVSEQIQRLERGVHALSRRLSQLARQLRESSRSP